MTRGDEAERGVLDGVFEERGGPACRFRRHTLLPLYDCLYALQVTIPYLTRSNLHRLFQRHDISCLPNVDGAKSRKKFKAYSDRLFPHRPRRAVNRRGQTIQVRGHRSGEQVRRTAREGHKACRRRLPAQAIELVPYKIHTVLIDNGTHFTAPGNKCSAAQDIKLAIQNGSASGLTPSNWPTPRTISIAGSPNRTIHGRMDSSTNRTIRGATVRRYYYESHERLRAHLATERRPAGSPRGRDC